MMRASCDVAVVGAGAAGLMAAIEAARRGRRTVLLEKNARPGLKILISGGGRCNLTTTKRGHDLERQYGTRRGRWLRHALRAFPPAALVAMFEGAGVPLREEDLDKVFPCSGRARDVLDALLGMAAGAGVELRREAPLQSVRQAAGGGFVVVTPGGELDCARLVLATGGLSYPKTGSTGDGYAVAAAFGHTIRPTFPHLAPLLVPELWVHELAGIVLDDAAIAVAGPGGEVLCRRRRPVLFTHRGLSGPGPMDLAGFVEESGPGCELRLDLLPDQSAEQVAAALLEASRRAGRRKAATLLPAPAPDRLRRALARRCGADVAAAQLTREQRRRLVRAVKDTRLPVERSLGLAHAEVTRGGVELAEVDSRTMISRRTPNLYFCGEILDVDGPIGGFNFQAAFATGRLAGRHA